jgi:hypothetical protein
LLSLGVDFPSLLQGRTENAVVAHLATGTGLAFAVEMEAEAGQGEEPTPVGSALGPEIAEEVAHDDGREEAGFAKGQAADGAQLLFELAGDAGVEAVVAGIMRTRGELVDEEVPSPGEEELDGEKADDIETGGDVGGDGLGAGEDAVGERRGGDGGGEDMMLVAVDGGGKAWTWYSPSSPV